MLREEDNWRRGRAGRNTAHGKGSPKHEQVPARGHNRKYEDDCQHRHKHPQDRVDGRKEEKCTERVSGAGKERGMNGGTGTGVVPAGIPMPPRVGCGGRTSGVDNPLFSVPLPEAAKAALRTHLWTDSTWPLL
jgi:hypothetical protein